MKMKGKASPPRKISIVIMQDANPYSGLSAPSYINLDEEEREYTVVLNTYKDGDFSKPVRVTYGLVNQVGTVWFSNVSIYKGRDPIIFSSESTLSSVYLPSESSPSYLQADYRLFIADCETKTEKELLEVVKNELGCKALVTSSQASYGNLLTFRRESTLSDFLDLHSYWNHPSFVTGHQWDKEYSINANKAMVDTLTKSTFPTLSLFRSSTKPSTISEYHHPFPNEHQEEMFPMLSSWAAYNDWDGIYEFDWGQAVNSEANMMTWFFSLSENPVHTVLAPFAALAFRCFGIETAQEKIEVYFPYEHLVNLNEKGIPYFYNQNSLRSMDNSYCSIPQLVNFTEKGSGLSVNDTRCISAQSNLPWTFGEVTWTDDGRYLANGTIVKMATGHIGKEEIDFNGIRVKVERDAEQTAAVAIGALDGKKIEESERILIAVVGRIMNTDQKWNNERNSTGKGLGGNWGKAPVLAEIVPFSISIDGGEDHVVTQLDKDGLDNGTIKYEKTETGIMFSSVEDKPSLWFLLTRSFPQPEAAPSTSDESPNSTNDDKSNINDNDDDDDDTVVIAVSVVAAVIVIVAAFAIFFILWRRKKSMKADTDSVNI